MTCQEQRAGSVLAVRTKVRQTLVSFLGEQILNALQAREFCLAVSTAAVPERLRDRLDLSSSCIASRDVVWRCRTDGAEASVETEMCAELLPSLGGRARDEARQIFDAELARLRNVGYRIHLHAKSRVLSITEGLAPFPPPPAMKIPYIHGLSAIRSAAVVDSGEQEIRSDEHV